MICNEVDSECYFQYEHYRKGEVRTNTEVNINMLIFCISGHIKITSNLFSEEFLCAGEILFVPRGSDYIGSVQSDTTLLIHFFSTAICKAKNYLLSFLYIHKPINLEERKAYCFSKLSFCEQLSHLLDSVKGYIFDQKEETALWDLKHRELMWLFAKYYSREELQLFFHPMTNEQIPFKSLVYAHYRKAEYTDKLAEMCGYPLHTFRRLFKDEFGVSPHRWLTIKRAELIKCRLSLNYIPFSDIIDEFNFSSPQQFNRFCKDNLGDAPTALRNNYLNQLPNVIQK